MMDAADREALVVIGIRAVAVVTAILGLAVTAGLAWRLFVYISGV